LEYLTIMRLKVFCCPARVLLVGAACAAGLLTLAGCGGGTVAVQGKATLDGKPVPAGAGVTFVPDGTGATASNTATGVVGADGTYKVSTGGKSGVFPGHYKVTISPPPATTGGGADPGNIAAPAKTAGPVTDPIPKKYEDASQTPLKVDVPGNYDLTLTH
jgi:hypothetical protein